MTMKALFRSFLLLLVLSLPTTALFPTPGLVPGTVYREHTCVVAMNGKDWRVTDPNTLFVERTQQFLPNPVLTIPDVRLEGALKAEVTLDYWSGHPGTTGKKIRFNEGKRWIPLEEHLEGAPLPAMDYYARYNLTLDVPLDHLVEGDNTIRGTCSDNAWGWGQWGWYSITLRVYLDPARLGDFNAVVKAVTDPTPSGHPAFQLEASDPERVGRVDYLARYHGLDENGEGHLHDYHGFYRSGEWHGHVGTAGSATENIVWDTSWVPDQELPVSLIARCRVDNAVWYVTPALTDVSLPERDYRIQLVTARQVPGSFSVRNHQVNSCILPLPLDFDPSSIIEARMFIRTWNAENNEQGYTPFRINHSPWFEFLTGPSHRFHMETLAIPHEYLRDGHNLFTFTSTTHHHGCEILWPGPQVLLKVPPASDTPTSPRPH